MMASRGKLRGHWIERDERSQQYLYSDTKQPTKDTYKQRPCGYCNQPATSEGHDPCLGTLLNVLNACCGHGVDREAYVMFSDRKTVRGKKALQVIEELRGKDERKRKAV